MEKETKFKSLKAFVDDAKTRRDSSTGLKPAKNARGDHVKVNPDEQGYYDRAPHGHYSGVPPTGIANPALGNVKALT